VAARVSYLGFGALFIARYVLEQPGDEVRRHTHVPEDPGHITIVASGRLRIHGPDFSHELCQGQIYDFPDSERTHALTALEPNTVILNINKADSTKLNEEFNMDSLHMLSQYLKAN